MSLETMTSISLRRVDERHRQHSTAQDVNAAAKEKSRECKEVHALQREKCVRGTDGKGIKRAGWRHIIVTKKSCAGGLGSIG